jgi:hypothetical protein
MCHALRETSDVYSFSYASAACSVEFVIQILKMATKLASEADARRREAWPL